MLKARRKTKRMLRAGGHLLRAILLLSFIAAAGAWHLWSSHEELVDGIDARAFNAYQERYSRGYREAMGLISESRLEEGAKALESLLGDMGEVKGQDRLVVMYASAVETLIRVYDSKGEHGRALELSEELVRIQPNHYRFWLLRAYQLERNGRRPDAVEALYRAYRIAPHSLDAAGSLADVLFHESRVEEARDVITGYLDANRSATVSLAYAEPGEPFSDKKTSSLASVPLGRDGRPLAFPVSGTGRATLKLGLLMAADLEVELKSIHVITDSGRKIVALDPDAFSPADMSRTGQGRFVITGDNPSVSFTLPEEFHAEALRGVEIEAAFTPVFPPRFNRMLRGA